MSLDNFLRYSQYRIREINSSNSIFRRIGERNATTISEYLLVNSIGKSTPEDTEKSTWMQKFCVSPVLRYR